MLENHHQMMDHIVNSISGDRKAENTSIKGKDLKLIYQNRTIMEVSHKVLKESQVLHVIRKMLLVLQVCLQVL